MAESSLVSEKTRDSIDPGKPDAFLKVLFGFNRAFRTFIKPILNSFTYLGMQATVYKDRILQIGVQHQKVLVGGNLKCDQDRYELSNEERDRLYRELAWGVDPRSIKIFIAGSTHEREEDIVFRVFAKLFQDDDSLRLIIAPRNPNRAEQVRDIGTAYGLKCRKWSESDNKNHNVIIVDTLGDLPRLYSLGEAAFIGGSLVLRGGP